MNDIKGLEQWEDEANEWNRMAGDLKVKAGVGMINALENWYAQYKTKATVRNKREYLIWRLRLHLRHNDHPEFLELLDETFDIGLHDDEVGATMWEIEPETKTGFHDGFNWRRDSGNALRGGRTSRRQKNTSTNVEE